MSEESGEISEDSVVNTLWWIATKAKATHDQRIRALSEICRIRKYYKQPPQRVTSEDLVAALDELIKQRKSR